MWSALGYIEMSENCCLCQRELTDSTSRKRRKKLYGKSAEKSREVLEALTEEKLHVSLAGIVETSSRNLYLCHSCDGELERFALLLRSELEHLSVKISDKLQCLRTVMHPTKK